MTSLKSSSHKNLFFSAYRNALGAGMLPFSLYLAGMAVLFPIGSVIELISDTQTLEYGYYYDEGITSLSQIYEYLLSPFGSELTLFVIAGTVASAVLMGISVFRFIVSKKTVNVYYSLGISRTNMFLACYTAGLTLLLMSIAVPVLLSGLISTAVLGFNAQIIPNMLYIIFLLFTLAALTFSVTSAVFSAVGSVIEGALFSVAIIAIPTLLFVCFEGLTEVLLYGNPYVLGWYPAENGDYVSLSMVEEFAQFNPLLYVHELLDSRYWWILETEQNEHFNSVGLLLSDNLVINVVPGLIWLGIGLIAAVIALRNYNVRKAEICGFFGKSTVLNFIMSFAVSLTVFSLFMYIGSEYSKALPIVLGFIAVAICYIIVNLILTRSVKVVLKHIYLLGAQLLILMLIVSVFLLGCFGYSSDVPKISEVKSANISPVAFENLLTGDNASNYAYFDTEELTAYHASSDTSTLGPYTDTKDIEKIMMVHRMLIEHGGKKDESCNAEIVIRYELYSGETFIRYYTKADMAIIRQILSLFESEFYDEKLEESFFGNDVGYKTAQFEFEHARVIAIDSRLKTQSYKYMNLTEQQFESLKRAVVDDIKAMTTEQFYKSDKPATGIIVFTSDMRINYARYDDMRLNEELEENKLHEFVYAAQSSAEDEAIIYITEDMINTLKFLNENDMMGYFPSFGAEEIESIAFYPATVQPNNPYYSAPILEFRARNTQDDFYAYYIENYDEQGNILGRDLNGLYMQNLVTDEERIAEILPLTRLNYFTFAKGYVAFITYKNGESVEKYITEEEAPDWVKNYEYVMNSYDLPE